MLQHLVHRIAGCLALAAIMAGSAYAQRPPIHYHYSADAPTGTLGKAQLLRGGPLAGYFQPVEISAPKGAAISLAEEGGFGEGKDGRALVGLRIGNVYHLKVTRIPLNEGVEVFPTIELLDRLYPPEGQELRFPIPIDLTLEELDHAANGRFVTRVIYLEDPRRALAVREDPDQQRYFEVPSDQDPLEVADRIGRPVAILRCSPAGAKRCAGSGRPVRTATRSASPSCPTSSAAWTRRPWATW
jgi:hypothetical protein